MRTIRTAGFESHAWRAGHNRQPPGSQCKFAPFSSAEALVRLTSDATGLKRSKLTKLAACGLLLATTLAASAAETVWLDSLDLSKMRQGWGKPQVNRSIRETPLMICGQSFDRGVGTHANSTLWLDLAGGTEEFSARVGVDDAAKGRASLVFRVVADGKRLFDSALMTTNQPAKKVQLDLRGVKTLLLQVTDGGNGVDYDHADWADAQFKVIGAKPQTLAVPSEPAVVLTPKPGPAPRVNGPKVYGCRPGNPFLYRIPAQGQRPMTFAADGLPAGLSLNTETGIITGTAPARGEYGVTLRARNDKGESSRRFKIVAGDTLALTPPMGWNHWYAHYTRVTDIMMRQAADVMISSGMADVGYDYVNIDDCWMNAPSAGRHLSDTNRVGPLRDARGGIQPNFFFPDMKALTDYIHSKGLKAGIYTSPGPLTCAGFCGTFQHEAQDAQTFADWGFDFLKYDWCSYGRIAQGSETNAPGYPSWKKGGSKDVEVYKYPYRLMGRILQQQKRDIVFNLCQYGMGDVWEWGAEVGGHCWRTAGDLGFELDRIFEVALKNAEHRAWSRPGAWNDPDYLQIGWVGDARGLGIPKPCPLTPNEQYAYMSLWVLMAAPLVYSGDMSKLDEFTLNVLCNPEVIEVGLDPLGQSAAVTTLSQDTFAMVKDLEDGSKAVGLFNRSEFPMEVALPWSIVRLSGPQQVRDLWRQQELGVSNGELKFTVPRHGAMLVKVSGKRG